MPNVGMHMNCIHRSRLTVGEEWSPERSGRGQSNAQTKILKVGKLKDDSVFLRLDIVGIRVWNQWYIPGGRICLVP